MKHIWGQLALINRGSRRIGFWAHAGLLAGFSLLFFLFLAGYSMLGYLERNVLGVVPDEELKVGIKKKDMAFFRVVEPGSKDALSQPDLDALNNIEGVKKVVPLTFGNHPSSANISFMGNNFTSDLVIQGFPPEWIEADVEPEKLAWEPGQTVPIVINSRLLSIYNNGYAKAQGMPTLSASAVMVPIWDLFYGPKGKPPVRLRARIVGLSPRVALGAAIPQNVLDYLHQQSGLPAPNITEAVLYLNGKRSGDAVRRAVDALGFAVDEPDPMARIFGQLKQIGAWGAVGLLLCICLFGFAFLNQTLKMLFLVKAHDYAICRALGMSRRMLRLALLSEATLMLALDLCAALAIGWTGAYLFAEHLLSPYLETLVGVAFRPTMPWSPVLMALLAIQLVGLAVLAPRILVSTSGPAGEFLDRA